MSCQLFSFKLAKLSRNHNIEISNIQTFIGFLEYIDQSPAFLTSDDFIRSNEIIRTKWPIA